MPSVVAEQDHHGVVPQLVPFNDLDDSPGGCAVRLLFVGVVGGSPGEGDTSAARAAARGVIFILGGAGAVLARRKWDPGATFRNVPAHRILEEAVGDLAD